jgi:hypothetical protein
VKVGIEHPILGLMTFTLIAAMVVSAIVLLGMVSMNVHDYILKTPVTEGYATCFSFDSGAGRYKYNVSIAVANSGRVDLRLEKLYVATDKGLVELTVESEYTVRTGVTVDDALVDFEIILLGFTRDTELWAGQRGLIRINMVSNKQLYTTGRQYSVTAYLTTIGFEAFTVREARFKVGEVEGCPPITSPPPAVPQDIILVSRAALYWDTFDTNPIGSRMTLVQEQGASCNAGYQASGHDRSGLVYLEVPAPYRVCALLVQGISLPNTGSIFVAFTALIEQFGIRDQPGLFGAILSWGTSLTHYYTGGFNKSNNDIFVRVRTPATTATSSSRHGVNWNTWYNGTLALTYELPNIPSTLAFYADRNYTSRSLATHERLTPNYVGLSIYKLTNPKWMRAYFDSMLVTVGERPWIVRVESLQPGWRVVLKDSSGRIIDSGVAGLGGVVELNVWGVWIIKNGFIELYDSSGNPLLPPKSFSEILGGDVYRVTG